MNLIFGYNYVHSLIILTNFLKGTTSSAVDNSITNSETSYYPSPYNLEDYCDSSKERAYFSIDPWKGAIIQLGYVTSPDGSIKSRQIHKCEVTIKTKSEFWLVAAVEHMKIRGNRDNSNKWQCEDYIKLISPGTNIVQKLFRVFQIDLVNNLFSAKKTEELCGNKKLDSDNYDFISEISTDANSFYTASSMLTLLFHQDNDDRHMANNSFKVVVTTFRHAGEEVFAVECAGKQKCYGKDIYCIDPSFICDGHVNCAFPGSATDERLCKVAEKPKIFNLTSIIIITLTSMVSFGILICVASTLLCKLKSRIMYPPRPRQQTFRHNFTTTLDEDIVPMPQIPTAPVDDGTLPSYDVVMTDDAGNKTKLEVQELPPKYESLFPEDSPSETKS